MKTVLILEDEDSIRKYLRQLVQSCDENLEIYDFANEKDALDFVLMHKIDIFLLDIMLDEEDSKNRTGISFATNIRDMCNSHSSEIIFITALAGLEVELLKKVHCFDYITKPFNEEQVRSVIHAVLVKLGEREEEELFKFRVDKVYYSVIAGEIIMIQSNGHSIDLHMVNEVIHIPGMSVKKALEQIRNEKFLEPRRGVAVNAKYIQCVDPINRYIDIRTLHTKVEISKRKKKSFMENYRS